MPDDGTESLIRAVASGDKAAFATLYRTLEGPLRRFIHLRLNDRSRSADIAHDVFLEVWRTAPAFEGRSSGKSWVFAIAYRKVIDVYRQQQRIVYEEDPPDQIDTSPDAFELLGSAQAAKAVQDCLATLSPEHRLAIELTFYEDMGYREIAEVMGIPEGTVKSRVFHAKQLLMRCLATRLGSKR